MDMDDIFGTARPVSLPTKSAIYVWGYNQSGQTGREGKERQLRIPKQLPPELFGCPAGANSRWLDIACGREHTAAVASDGSLFTWGANDFGQLGDGTEEGRKYPTKVKQLQTEFVKSVSCGAHCTAAIAEPRENDGTISTRRLWVWGQNQGSDFPRLYWGAFPQNTIIRQVSCGAVHVVALSEDGLLQAWGYNEFGQLGRGITCEGLQGARVINAYAKFLDEAPELVKITQVSCGEYHTAAISEKGEVYTWGLGSMGQLGHCSLQSGDKELLPRRVVALDGILIKDVACGGVHTCAVTQKGALYAWGGGQSGQLGLGPQTGFFSCVPNDSKSLLRNIPVLVVPTGVQLVACGNSHTLISSRDGRIHGWGYNSYGQAANEKSSYAWCVGEVRKLAAGGGHSAVLTDACSLKELCEFRLADSVTPMNASEVGDVASRTGAEALARLCERLRCVISTGLACELIQNGSCKISSEHMLDGGGCGYEDEISGERI
ncbi:ultraviolet-B receptor UVR8 isoform X2 [Ziziphus jujuba]|uniref:Ultraviolet-B receptor UVR8 isoform X2 n=1 Tax=Ziziphus jujuba TaxID=326968 RepID=A0ABM3IFL8_ZIZJJ|nr:ultraviolet-B receptor UVR8 isoform X2 [Ziziphus jujuba]